MKMKHENKLCVKFSLDIHRRVCKPKLLIVLISEMPEW